MANTSNTGSKLRRFRVDVQYLCTTYQTIVWARSPDEAFDQALEETRRSGVKYADVYKMKVWERE